jgi:hypothetical protein
MISLIRLERLKRGLRQEDVYALTDIPQWRISLLERGMPPLPDERKKLASVLGLPEEEIGEQLTV